MVMFYIRSYLYLYSDCRILELENFHNRRSLLSQFAVTVMILLLPPYLSICLYRITERGLLFTTTSRITHLCKNISQYFHFYVKKNKAYTTGEMLPGKRTVIWAEMFFLMAVPHF